MNRKSHLGDLFILILSVIILAMNLSTPIEARAQIDNNLIDNSQFHREDIVQKIDRLHSVSELKFVSIAAADSHTCALTSGGGVKCWGVNWDGGRLGDGTSIDYSFPIDVIGLTSGVVEISAGANHTCALTNGGGVKCWGANYRGELGDGTTTNSNIAVDVVGLTSGVISISAGLNHTCALTSEGGVKCWGSNWDGQLGNGASTGQYPTPVNVFGLDSGITAIAAGGYHTCALTSGGGVKCWGLNIYGQVGDGTTTDRTVPVDVEGLNIGAIAITTGYSHTCALTSENGVKCWGWNVYGQLGDGTNENSDFPVNVIGLTDGVSAITAGGRYTCVLNTNGGGMCWGDNSGGQLGDGTKENRSLPVDVVGLSSGTSSISAGGFHTCATMTNGNVKCWGMNEYGQLGDGTMINRSASVDVIGFSGGVSDIALSRFHTCVLTNIGGVMCWGSNSYGQLGDGTLINRTFPVDVIGLSTGVIAISAGDFHTCALTSDGGVKCWGWNAYGQLGDGTTVNKMLPVDVIGMTSGVDTIAVGRFHSCALSSEGGVKCWGRNIDGQLGDNTTTDRSTPIDVIGLSSDLSDISTGGYHTCALNAQGGAKCWGNNEYGQLGDGTETQRNIPVDVVGLQSEVSDLSAGGLHTCARLTTNGMKCWGWNMDGQLGDNTTTDRSIPVDVSGLTDSVTNISAGYSNTCAQIEGGKIKCWGYNRDGQLGDGTKSNRNTPVDVDGMASGVSSVATGGLHTCALVGSGRPKCFGSDNYGQLGVGTILERLVPIYVVESMPPSLMVNYPYGRPGSYITITGWNFPSDTTITLSINGEILSSSVSVSSAGTFILFLDSNNADVGSYFVNTSVNPSTKISFILGEVSPLRIQEGGGDTFEVPIGIAYDDFIYLPILRR